MAKYNLVINSNFNALTSSGTGDVSLTWSQLESLMDGDLTSSGVGLTSSDVLYLESDFSQRIKIDDIRLYTNDLTKSSNIKFYYRDTDSDSYTLLTTNVSSYYYTTIPDPSAPRYVRVTISGVDMNLNEFQIFNDDYIVAFGTDGQLYAEYINDTPIGSEGTPQTIPIYNNGSSTVSVDAYVSIDYTSTSGDRYIKISDSLNGTYYGLDDGVLIEDNNTSSNYTWDMGDYVSNVELEEGQRLVLTNLYDTDKLCDLPLADGSESLNVGESAMVYDSRTNSVYALMSEATPTILKLYEYDVSSNEWSYLWEVNPGVSNFEDRAGLCLLGDYVYIICNNITFDFGKYNVVTRSGVWEPLTSPTGLSTHATNSFSLCTDENEYIYMACLDGYAVKSFQKYSTVSGVWDDLDNGFGAYSYGSVLSTIVSLCYDIDRDYIYCSAGEYTYTYQYISRYIVSTDIWQTDYLNRTPLGGPTVDVCINYYNNNIVIYGTGFTPTAYIYDIVTDTSRYISVGDPTIHPWSTSAANKTCMCIVDPQKSDDIFSIIFGNVSSYLDEIYGYNMDSIGSKTGYYTSPVFVMDDPDESSFFVVDTTTDSNYTSVSYDDSSYNGTIQYRTTDDEPLKINIIYPHNAGWYIDRKVPYTSEEDNLWYAYSSNWYVVGIAVDQRTGNIAISYRYYANESSRIHIIDKNGSLLYSNAASYTYNFNKKIDFDSNGGVWGYGTKDTPITFRHLNNTLAVELASVEDYSYDFVYDFAVEYGGDGIWYTNKIDNYVEHLDYAGTSLQQINLIEPRAICSTLSKGCWVSDNNNSNIYKYSFSGSLVTTLNFGDTITRMVHDFNDGFWYIADNYVYHVRGLDYHRDVSINLSGADRLIPTYDGCWVQSDSSHWLKFVEYPAGIVKYTYSLYTPPVGYSWSNPLTGVFTLDIDRSNEYKFGITDYIPASYDPIWGTGGSLEWQEINKDGHFLPKKKYHQIKLTLRSSENSLSPSVDGIIMSPTVKLSDVPVNNYKNAYIKTDIPISAIDNSYTTGLKVWWETED